MFKINFTKIESAPKKSDLQESPFKVELAWVAIVGTSAFLLIISILFSGWLSYRVLKDDPFELSSESQSEQQVSINKNRLIKVGEIVDQRQ